MQVVELLYLVQKRHHSGEKKKIPPTTRIALRVLIPQNLKHINFSLENSEKAVNGSQISAKLTVLKKKGFNFQKKEVDALEGATEGCDIRMREVEPIICIRTIAVGMKGIKHFPPDKQIVTLNLLGYICYIFLLIYITYFLTTSIHLNIYKRFCAFVQQSAAAYV